MKVLIFGGGAVGLGLAGCLCKNGISPDIIAREKTCELLTNKGLKRKGIFGESEFNNFKVYSELKAVNNEEYYDNILICTKSNDSENTAIKLSSFNNLISEKTNLVLCQNGWGNMEIFSDYFPSRQIFNARIITGFTRPAPNCSEITVHASPIKIGSLSGEKSDSIENLCTAINNGGIECEPTITIEKDLWAKMLFNCSLNPLGAIFRVPYGKLAASSYALETIKKIIEEIFMVIKAAGYSTWWDKPETYYNLLIKELIPVTAKHESSTLQDLRSGKKTEIEALTGAVVRLGEKFSTDVSVNRTIYNMIKFLEER